MDASTMAGTAPDWRTRATQTVDQAAEIMGVSRSTAYLAVRAGQLPTIVVSRRTFVLTAGLRRLLGETSDGGAA